MRKTHSRVSNSIDRINLALRISVMKKVFEIALEGSIEPQYPGPATAIHPLPNKLFHKFVFLFIANFSQNKFPLHPLIHEMHPQRPSLYPTSALTLAKKKARELSRKGWEKTSKRPFPWSYFCPAMLRLIGAAGREGRYGRYLQVG